MTLQAYSVYDSKAQVFAKPFFELNNGTALRAWSQAVNDPKTAFNEHPEDYSLHHIGEYSDETATLTPIRPTNLGLAASYIKGVQ